MPVDLVSDGWRIQLLCPGIQVIIYIEDASFIRKLSVVLCDLHAALSLQRLSSNIHIGTGY